MFKLAYGVRDYRKIREENCYYVDKTNYLKLLEEEGDILAYFRPDDFGKSLFISMMYYYYDINSKKIFNDIFKDTFIFGNCTDNKNNYYVLRFDFSNMIVSNDNLLEIEREFFRKVIDCIKTFNCDYGFDFNVSSNDVSVSELMLEFLSYFRMLNLKNKLYIMIDGYDNFFNTVLFKDKDKFISIVNNISFVSNFYSIIKEYYDNGIISRVFIAGVSPILLDEMGIFSKRYINISSDSEFLNMVGLSSDEVLEIISNIKDVDRDKLFKILLDNYSGYRYSKDSDVISFNTSLVMSFMREYTKVYRIPNVSLSWDKHNYNQLDILLKLGNEKYYNEILESIFKQSSIMGESFSKFDINGGFTQDNIISLLYYYGYLTIKEGLFGNSVIWGIPNYSIRDFWGNYFLKILNNFGVLIDNNSINDIFKELVLEGRVDKLSSFVELILKFIDNKFFMKVDEEFIKFLYYVILSGSSEFFVYNDYKRGESSADLVLFKNIEMCRNNIMIEIRYLNSKDRINKKLIDKVKKEAFGELVLCQDINSVDKNILRKYVVIFSGNNLVLVDELI